MMKGHESTSSKSEVKASSAAAHGIEALAVSEPDAVCIPIQCNLIVGAPDDPMEQEANQMADKVVGAPSATASFVHSIAQVHNSTSVSGRPSVSFAQRNESGGAAIASSHTAQRIQSAQGGGYAMPGNTRSLMEANFGADFSSVRIHTDANAAQLSHNLHANAFTVGNDIFFNSSKYAPDSREGQHLLAHELTHTVQQGRASSHIQRNMVDEEDRIHEGIAEAYRARRGYDPEGKDGGPTDAEIKYRSNLPNTPRLFGDEIASRIEEAVLSARHDTVLTPSYISKAIAARDTNPELDHMFFEIDIQVATLDFDHQMDIIERSPRRIIPILERQFISNPDSSSLDLLDRDPSRYRTFEWSRNDFPGGPAGPNEGRAIAMHNELDEVRSERRPNSGKDAVITQEKFDQSAPLRRYIISQLRPIPDFETVDGAQPVKQPRGHKLNKDAQEAFLRMRDAAQAEGVFLIIGSSYRSPEEAKRNAEAAGNSNAVASFSSHSLGLAFDLNLSYTDRDDKKHTYAEMTTKPMQNVVNMRESAAHKWMFIHGAEYGFYPFQQEPWHWEYNPPGFPEAFMDAFKNKDSPESIAKAVADDVYG